MLKSYDEISLRKLQQAELEILDAVALLCQQHNIEWFLSYGSALGAARHQGFIPWDDDIDIAMLRPDYDRFIHIAKKQLPQWLSLHVPGEDPTLATTFVKICKRGTQFLTQETIDAGFNQGIFIDVVPYDRISNNPRMAQKQKRTTRNLRYMLFLYHSSHVNFLGKSGMQLRVLQAAAKLSHAVLRVFTSNEALQKKWDKAARKASGEFDASYASFHSMYDVVVPEQVLVPVGYATMEGRAWPVPGNLTAYLESLYGKNWNELPPLAERRNHAPLVLKFNAEK